MKALWRIISLLMTMALLSTYTAAASMDEAIKAEVTREILENSPWDGNDVEIEELQLMGFDPAIDRYDSVKANMPKGAKGLGKVSVSVTLYMKGKEVKSIWASARVKVFREVAVALNALRMNQKISAGDLKMQRMEVRDMPDVFISLKELEGMLAKRPISAGSVIKKDYIKPEALIKRGEKVAVVIENKKLRIKTVGTATEDGYRDGFVTVRTGAGKEVSGRVSGPGEMTIEF